MKNWIKNLSKERIQQILFIGTLILVFVAFFVSLSLLDSASDPVETTPTNVPTNTIVPTDTLPTDTYPPQTIPTKPTDTVVKQKFTLPLSIANYTIVKKYYDKSGTAVEQELAVIQFGSTYFMSQGIAIKADDDTSFPVVCALDGEVATVEESPLHGYIVKVKHANDVFTEYSSLASVEVEVGDKVVQGDKLGLSGICEYDKGSGNHVQFKIFKGSTYYNPLSLIGKTTEDVK